MKCEELHALVRKNGWSQVRQKGSHIIYQKDNQTYPIPYHKGKEIGKGLERRIKKEMKLK
jgi:predicted RNA binding protein YcfA (HicA-like mRNA interferase family)